MKIKSKYKLQQLKRAMMPFTDFQIDADSILLNESADILNNQFENPSRIPAKRPKTEPQIP